MSLSLRSCIFMSCTPSTPQTPVRQSQSGASVLVPPFYGAAQPWAAEAARRSPPRPGHSSPSPAAPAATATEQKPETRTSASSATMRVPQVQQQAQLHRPRRRKRPFPTLTTGARRRASAPPTATINPPPPPPLASRLFGRLITCTPVSQASPCREEGGSYRFGSCCPTSKSTLSPHHGTPLALTAARLPQDSCTCTSPTARRPLCAP